MVFLIKSGALFTIVDYLTNSIAQEGASRVGMKA